MTNDKLTQWETASDRVKQSCAAMIAANKTFALGGEVGFISEAWASVEAARATFLSAVSYEKNAFKKLLAGMEKDQQEMNVDPADRIVPTHEGEPIRVVQRAPRQLEAADAPPAPDVAEG